jgi:hypothetical protein
MYVRASSTQPAALIMLNHNWSVCTAVLQRLLLLMLLFVCAVPAWTKLCW